MSKSIINIDTGRGRGVKHNTDDLKKRLKATAKRGKKKLRYVHQP